MSDADRSLCSEALAEQFGLGRIDKTELDRRPDLLYAAKTRGHLSAVFEGLPAPVLDKPPGKAAVAVLSVPFLVLGAAMMSSPPNVATFLVGEFLFVGALGWNYFAWFWATRAHR